jgi:hypothetical protein
MGEKELNITAKRITGTQPSMYQQQIVYCEAFFAQAPAFPAQVLSVWKKWKESLPVQSYLLVKI